MFGWLEEDNYDIICNKRVAEKKVQERSEQKQIP